MRPLDAELLRMGWISMWLVFFFFSSRRRHTRWNCDWSSDVCSSDLTTDPPDISHVMQGIEELLDQSIAAVPFTIGEKASGWFDLSKIDFEALRKKFEIGRASCRERV